MEKEKIFENGYMASEEFPEYIEQFNGIYDGYGRPADEDFTQ